MSFNVRTAEVLDIGNEWEKRRGMVFERVRAFAPDLLGLQECHDFQQAQDVRAELTDYRVHRGAARGRRLAPLEMTPALVRLAAFEVVTQRNFWLSRTPDVPGSTSWGSAYVRTAVLLHLRERSSGRELAWIHTHFDFSPIAVHQSARLLRRELESLPAGLPVVVTGDFNTTKISSAYRVLLGARSARPLFDAYRVANPKDRWEGSYHAYGYLPIALAFDWILVSGEFRVLGAGIDRSQTGGRFPSDHFPIWAVLDLD